MVKGLYQSIRKIWRNPKNVPNLKQKLIKWRKETVIKRVEKPTRLDRARSLGYKAKQGFIVARIKIKKGGRKRARIKKGRVPKKSGRVKFTPAKSLKRIAEDRVARKYPNMEVLNSYYLAEDGQNKYYEVILVDRAHPVIRADKKLQGIIKHRGRVFRGKTSAGQKSRALRK